MIKISAHTKRKWWYRTIRSVNWFSFRYWWFIWIVFLIAVLLFMLKCCDNTIKSPRYQDKLVIHLNSIDSLLYDCCECELLIEDSIVSSPPPVGTLPCDDSKPRTYSGSNIVHKQTYDIGSTSGVIPICYNTGNTYPDNVKVVYDGQTIFESGSIITNDQMVCKQIPFNYKAGGPTFLEVIVVPSNDQQTQWVYTLGCPN